MAQRLTFSQLYKITLCELSDLMDLGEYTHYSLNDIVQNSRVISGIGRISVVLESAVDEGFVQKIYFNPSGNEYEVEEKYRLSKEGLEQADIFFKEPDVFAFLREQELELAGIGHNSGTLIDLDSRNADVAEAVVRIEAATETVRNDNQIDEQTKEATLSAFAAARDTILRGGKQFVGAFLNPILVGVRMAVQQVAAEQAKPLLEGFAKWFLEIFVGKS
jgi:hypothetical protein